MVFVTNAISPAKVQRVTIMDPVERVMEVVVEDRQLSLAIGKKGQNVRLAAKLSGWKIDIKSEEDKRREVEEQFGALAADALAETEGAAAADAAADAADGVVTEGAADAAIEAPPEAAEGGPAPDGDAQQ
jgi:N utilization substance protein A